MTLKMNIVRRTLTVTKMKVVMSGFNIAKGLVLYGLHAINLTL